MPAITIVILLRHQQQTCTMKFSDTLPHGNVTKLLTYPKKQ